MLLLWLSHAFYHPLKSTSSISSCVDDTQGNCEGSKHFQPLCVCHLWVSTWHVDWVGMRSMSYGSAGVMKHQGTIKGTWSLRVSRFLSLSLIECTTEVNHCLNAQWTVKEHSEIMLHTVSVWGFIMRMFEGCLWYCKNDIGGGGVHAHAYILNECKGVEKSFGF